MISAHRAAVGSGPCMGLLVPSEGVFAAEGLATIVAMELRPGRVGHPVGPQIAGAVKTLPTFCAAVAAFVLVHLFMGLETGGSREAFTALPAKVRPLPSVCPLVYP